MPIRLKLLHDWDQQLHSLLPGVRSTRVQVLALFSLGLLWAGNVTLLRIAHALPLQCSASSTERRLRRWLANSQVPVTAMLRPLVKVLLTSRAGCKIVLTLDPTPLGGVLTGQVYNAYVLGLVVRGRVLPLLWYIASNQQDWQVQERWVISRLLRVVASWLPPDCSVTLVADRGLTGPELIGACEAVGWHYVLRVSCDSKQGPKLRDGSWLWELVRGPGQRLYTEVELFRSAGWIRVGLSIYWDKGYDEPWILISDRSAGLCRVLEYKRRWRAEPTYQDCKGALTANRGPGHSCLSARFT